MPQVSIVIPVYNSEKYIARCLDSIINQSLADIEIIVLNDGSKDCSEQIIIHDYLKDPRVVYHKYENSGPGKTRNRGIALATGDYVTFVDSDDFIELDMLDELVHQAKRNNADIVCCGNYHYVEGNHPIVQVQYKESCVVSIEKIGASAFFANHYYNKSSWAKLYKLDMITKNHIQFATNQMTGEDQFFNYCALICADRIYFSEKVLYHYIKHPTSIMRSYQGNYLSKRIEMIEMISNIVDQSLRKEAFHKLLATHLLDVIFMESRNNLKFKKGFKQLYVSVKSVTSHKHTHELLHLVLYENAYAIAPRTKHIKSKKWIAYFIYHRVVHLTIYSLYLFTLSHYLTSRIKVKS